MQHQDAVAHAEQLGEFAGDEHHGFSGVGELVDDLVDLQLRADVDAARGLVEEDDAGLGHERLAEHDFLLVAAGEFADGGGEAGGFHAQGLEGVGVFFQLTARVDESCAREAGEGAEREVEADGLIEHEAVAAAVFAHERDAAAEHVGGGQGREFAAFQRDAPRSAAAPRAEEVHEQLGAPRAHEPADAEHLARREGEGDVAQPRLAGARVGDAEAIDGHCGLRIADCGLGIRRSAPGKKIADFPAHHVADDLGFARLRRRRGEDGRAVAEDGDAVGEGEDFVQLVGDVDARDALRAQVAEDREEDLHLVLGERGGGLVEDEDARVFAQRLHDLDELLFPHAEMRDGRGGVDRDLEAPQQRARVAMHARPVDERPPARLGAEEDILRDGHLLDQRQLLIDDGEPSALRVGDGPEMRGLAVRDQLPLVAAMRVQAAQELDERGFPRAVLAA